MIIPKDESQIRVLENSFEFLARKSDLGLVPLTDCVLHFCRDSVAAFKPHLVEGNLQDQVDKDLHGHLLLALLMSIFYP